MFQNEIETNFERRNGFLRLFSKGTGLGPYYGFIVFVNDDQDVFFEHRNDALIAAELVEHDVVQHLDEVA
jgi:hypothetical protein